MHTAVQLDTSMFDVTVDGKTASREALFPEWGPHDRLGVVVTHPLGALGASYLIQLAMTAFYDIRPERKDPDDLGQYPDIYLFHVGRRFGDFSPFDFWPPRKEVFTSDKPADVLDVINDKAITRLAVPEGSRQRVVYPLKEPEAAKGRITSCFLYSPTGVVAAPDVTISSSSSSTEENGLHVLEPMLMIERMDEMEREAAETPVGETPILDTRELEMNAYAKQLVLDRLDEVDSEDRASAARARQALVKDGVTTEHYRRITIDEALERLVPAG